MRTRGWKAHQVAPPTTAAPQGFRQGCTVRTDSHGVVYAFFTHFSETSNTGAQTMVTSSTGGTNWGKPVDFMQMNDACFFVDPVAGRCNMEGPAGARTDLMAMPSVDIANGAPTGADATNELVDVWSGLEHGTLRSAAIGAGVWTDVPNTADCPAMDAWRQACH